MVVFTMVDYWKYSRGFPIKNTLNDTNEKYQKELTAIDEKYSNNSIQNTDELELRKKVENS